MEYNEQLRQIEYYELLKHGYSQYQAEEILNFKEKLLKFGAQKEANNLVAVHLKLMEENTCLKKKKSKLLSGLLSVLKYCLWLLPLSKKQFK